MTMRGGTDNIHVITTSAESRVELRVQYSYITMATNVITTCAE